MTDYWQIISLINEILTIYQIDTFKFDFIKEAFERDLEKYNFSEFIDSIKVCMAKEDRDFPSFNISIYQKEIIINVVNDVDEHNDKVDFIHRWKIFIKFKDERISSITIKCLSPYNNKDFLGYREAFNSESRKRISRIEQIVWGYILNEDYVVDRKAQLVDTKKGDDEGPYIRHYIRHTELIIDIHQGDKPEDINVLEEDLRRVNKGEPPIDIDPHFGVNVDPRTGGIIDSTVDETPHTDVNQSNNDPLPEKTEKRLRGWERMLEDIKSDEAIMKKIDIRNMDSLWNGLVELFSQEHYSDCIKSETSIEYTLYFERYFMSHKNHDYSKEKITFDLDKEKFIHCRGYIDDNDEPAWFLTFIYTEENGLVDIYATSLRELEMLKLVHFSHVRDLIRQLADAGFLSKSVV